MFYVWANNIYRVIHITVDIYVHAVCNTILHTWADVLVSRSSSLAIWYRPCTQHGNGTGRENSVAEGDYYYNENTMSGGGFSDVR